MLASVGMAALFLLDTDHTRGGVRGQSADAVKFEVKVADEYLLGDKVLAVVSLINQEHRKQKVKHIAMSEFRIKLSGPFGDGGPDVREYTYDGSRGVTAAKGSDKHGLILWTVVKKEDVELDEGESTKINIDLSAVNTPAFEYAARFSPGEYTLTAESGDGRKIERNFKIVVDQEKTLPLLASKMKSGDQGERNWAAHQMVNIDKAKAIMLLEGMLSSENESLRNWAAYYLDVIGYRKL